MNKLVNKSIYYDANCWCYSFILTSMECFVRLKKFILSYGIQTIIHDA